MVTCKNDVRYIFTAYITWADGTHVYASEYGLKAFRIPIQDKRK